MNSNSYSLSDSSLELVVSLGSSAPCLSDLIFVSLDILFFIDEMVGTVSIFFLFFFLLCGFSFTNINESQDCRGRGRVFL